MDVLSHPSPKPLLVCPQTSLRRLQAQLIYLFTRMNHVLGLPLEIRNMIYENCLVVGKVFPLFSQLSWGIYEFLTPSTDNQVPKVALLSVSNQIHSETEKILYSNNTFVMPVLEDMEKLLRRYLHTPRRNALLWIRSVEFTFHTHDLSRTKLEILL